MYLSNRVDVVETPIQPSIDEQSPPPIKKTKSGEQRYAKKIFQYIQIEAVWNQLKDSIGFYVLY